MNRIRIHPSIWLVALLITLAASSLTRAQNSESEPGNDEQLMKVISERRIMMEQRLENLKRTEESLGDNHPSVESVRAQRAGLEQELAAWASPRESLLEISDRDLRAIVLQLSIRIDRLENRTATSKPVNARGLGRSPGR